MPNIDYLLIIAPVTGFHRRATVAQTVTAGYETKVSEQAVYCNGHVSITTGPWSNGSRRPGPMDHVFFYIT